MKQILISILVVFSISSGYSQFEIVNWDWDKTDINQQVQYWENKSVKVENKILDDKLIRVQYFESGKLQLKSEIIQIRKIDTAVTYHPVTLDTAWIRPQKIFEDYPSGKYEEYYESGELKVRGQMKSYIKTGEWTEFWENSEIKKITIYNSEGNKLGLFKEYYKNGQLKTLGQYGIEEVSKKEICFNPETFEEYDCELKKEVEIKVGKWQYFNE